MSATYGAMAPPGADQQRNRLAALIAERQRGGPLDTPVAGMPAQPPPGQGAGAQGQGGPPMPQSVPPAGGMPQAQPAATGPAGPPMGPMGTGVGGPLAPGLALPGVPQMGQPLPMRY
jgi:hypothetical protein